MKDNPSAMGSAAMILYYAVDSDNTNWTETQSFRIKVFREEGRKYANVEIPYYDKEMRVEEIRARTVGPDGKKEEFGGEVYDREVMKAKKVRVSAKVLTLPNVQPGSILEYSYKLRFKEKLPDVFRHPAEYLIDSDYTYPAAQWEIQRSLFMRHGHFILHPVKGVKVGDFYVALPKGVIPQRLSDGAIQIDIDDVPAYEDEDYSPPEENLKIRADMYYAVGLFSGDSYWMGVAKRKGEAVDKFIGNSKAIQEEVGRLLNPESPTETKLRQIYARVQKIRALSYEGERTGQQTKQENLKENKSAEDVLVHGYARANEINLLFVALARAAGIDTSPLLVASRRNALFMKGYPNERQLDAMVVVVRTEKSVIYLDPATRFCPYGLLPWDELSTVGVVLGSHRLELESTPASNSTDATAKRAAEFKLNADGGLSGKVVISYFGQEALSRRLDAIRHDDAERQKELEESLKNILMESATVKLLKVEGWEDSESALKAEFEVDVPNFANAAGRRLILPLGVFHTRDKNPFSSTRRTHPIYFSYPAESYEEVKIELPSGMQVEFLPADAKTDQGAVYFELSSKMDGAAIHSTRTFRISSLFFQKEQYKNLRAFYDHVAEGDAHQATLRIADTAGSN